MASGLPHDMVFEYCAPQMKEGPVNGHIRHEHLFAGWSWCSRPQCCSEGSSVAISLTAMLQMERSHDVLANLFALKTMTDRGWKYARPLDAKIHIL